MLVSLGNDLAYLCDILWLDPPLPVLETVILRKDVVSNLWTAGYHPLFPVFIIELLLFNLLVSPNLLPLFKCPQFSAVSRVCLNDWPLWSWHARSTDSVTQQSREMSFKSWEAIHITEMFILDFWLKESCIKSSIKDNWVIKATWQLSQHCPWAHWDPSVRRQVEASQQEFLHS